MTTTPQKLQPQLYAVISWGHSQDTLATFKTLAEAKAHVERKPSKFESHQEHVAIYVSEETQLRRVAQGYWTRTYGWSWEQ
jgi:hypothetical protein